jgi:DNA uptake protein ComE-like DNA-binding protein
MNGKLISRSGNVMALAEKSSRAKNSNRRTFRNCDDLQKVKGIGPKTVQNISHWLKFE